MHGVGVEPRTADHAFSWVVSMWGFSPQPMGHQNQQERLQFHAKLTRILCGSPVHPEELRFTLKQDPSVA